MINFKVIQPFRSSVLRGLRLFVVVMLFVAFSFLSINPVIVNAGSVRINHLDAPKANRQQCESKILWYTSGSDVCAYSADGKKFTWQKIIKRSDTSKMMSTCRTFFATASGRELCAWVDKYITNLERNKAPRDTCISYIKAMLDHAATVAQTSKSATLGSALTSYSRQHSWKCHPWSITPCVIRSKSSMGNQLPDGGERPRCLPQYLLPRHPRTWLGEGVL